MTQKPLWTAQDAADATDGQVSGSWAATGVSIDSRTLEPGDLFIALKGPNFDGHTFIAEALAKGAAAVVSESLPEGMADNTSALLVPDTFKALQDLGEAGRARSQATVIAVTGSVGKTGTKEALQTCLGFQAPTHASVGSFNNQWGVPLSLARLPQEAGYAIFELGMNHPGEIGPLSRMVQPDVAVITAIEAAHTEFFKSLAEIADAKAEIFDGLRPGGAAVLPRDNPHYGQLVSRAEAAGVARVVSFGHDTSADARLLECEVHPDKSEVTAEVAGKPYSFTIAVPGMHWVSNALAVLAAVHAVGGDVWLASQALARLTPPAGRGEQTIVRLPGGPFAVVDETYNASPSSVRAALAVLGNSEVGQGGRRIAVLGDMRELGINSAIEHSALLDVLKAEGIDLVFTCGPEIKVLADVLPESLHGGHREDSVSLAELVAQDICPGDVVLVKGSKAVRMGRVLEALHNLNREARNSAANER